MKASIKYYYENVAVAIVFALVLLLSNAQAAVADTTSYRPVPGFPFVFISEDSTAVAPEIGDSLFNEIARGIRFKVNKTYLQPGDPFIKIYNEQIAPMLLDKGLVLHKIMVRGAASPEGPYENNRRLGRARTARLVEFIGSKLQAPIDTSVVSAASITEDYGYLVELMRRNADPDYEAVRSIWTDSRGDERYCKRKLMGLRDGEVWNRIVWQYFPTLRSARMVLWFGKNVPRHPAAAAKEELVMPTGLTVAPPEPIRVDLPGLTFIPRYTRRHLIAARTNLVHDFFYMPQFGWAPGANIQLEYYPLTGHYTYNAGFTWTNHRHWNSQEFFQIRDLRLELRRYFKGGGEFIGPFLDAYAHGAVYGIGLSPTKGWQGEGGGAGIGGGYTMRLNRSGSLRLEFTAQLGFFVTKYDPYVWGNPVTGSITGDYYYDFTGRTADFKKRNHRFFWLGPTNFGIHITYDIIYRKRKPAGFALKEGGAL